MKTIFKFYIYLFVSLAVLPTFLKTNIKALDLSAHSAVLINQDDGSILYSKNEDIRLPMASTTKIMTALLALESGRLSDEVLITAESVGVEGSSIYLEKSDKITLESLVWALMLESANDAASSIAVFLGGSVEGFAEMMNDKAAELQLKNTHFTNPHGLYDEEHYTTAIDLARISAAAMDNELFSQIVATKKHTISFTSAQGEIKQRYLNNHNKMLNMYEGASGIKTGFTKKSGRCLVSAASRYGVELIAVTLSAPDDWKDHKSMLDYGFSLVERVELAKDGRYAFIMKSIGTKETDVVIKSREGLSVILRKCNGAERNISERVILPKYFWRPVTYGEIVGYVEFYEENNKIGEVPLYAEQTTNRISYEDGLFGKLFD